MKEKKISRIIVVAFILFTISGLLFAQNKLKNAEFKVYGNCGMCKTRIEKAVKVKGVVSANWNIKTKILKIRYAPSVISLKTIHKNIAKVGHDTDMEKASNEVYNKLPACCKYKRKK